MVESGFFNFNTRIANDRWDRSSFLRSWWRIYASDPRWVPPYYLRIRREIEPQRNPHLERLEPVFIYLEALPRPEPVHKRGMKTANMDVNPMPVPLWEVPLAAGVALSDPRRRDQTAYLALIHAANDAESLERLFEKAAEILAQHGFRKVIGPVGLSPHLMTGLLSDHWNVLPPLLTPYDPPYLPEIIAPLAEPILTSRLYWFDLAAHQPPAPDQDNIAPLDLNRLGKEMLTVFNAAFSEDSIFPSPDLPEAAYLLRSVGQWRASAWQVQRGGAPVGFVLLGPDYAPALKRARGGRRLAGRLWLAFARRRPARSGRVYFAGVLPDWRGQGIGRQLIHQALEVARDQGWERLSIGPILEGSGAAQFLEQAGAQPQQTYRIYKWEV